jgi:hypothetical protein
MMQLVAIDHRLKEMETERLSVRQLLQGCLEEQGVDKITEEGVGTVSMVAGAHRKSYSTAKCDDLLVILLRDAQYDYADLLVTARSETVSAPYMVFKSEKKRGDNE